MTDRKKPATCGRSGLSENVLSLAAGHSEHSPNPFDFQQQARRRLAEAHDLTGAAQFAALSLAAHFGRLAGGAHV